MDSSNNKFSIITSSYNNEAYLKDWADSILRQKYRPLEVVFANDCSTDNTLEVVDVLSKDFIKHGIEFRLVSNEKRLKPGDSCDKLTSLATGFYTGILDSDDMLTEGAVEYIVKQYEKHPEIAWIYTQFEYFYSDRDEVVMGWNSVPDDGTSMLDMVMHKSAHTFGHWRTFSDRLPNKTKLFGTGIECAEDKFMGYKLEELAQGMYVDKVCYKYRVDTPDSVTKRVNDKEAWLNVIQASCLRRKLTGVIPLPVKSCNSL